MKLLLDDLFSTLIKCPWMLDLCSKLTSGIEPPKEFPFFLLS